MDRVMRVVGQGAAVPHRGLSYIQDLITHCLLVVVVAGEVGGHTESPERGRGEVEEGGEELKREGGRWGVEGRDRKVGPVSSKAEKEVIR